MRTRAGHRPWSGVPRPAAPTVQTDISETIPPKDGPHALKGWQERAQGRQVASAEAMGLFRQMTEHLGGIHNLAKAVPRGDVLGQMTVTIPANGHVTKTWRDNFQAVSLVNLGAAAVVATTAGELAEAPSVGSGVAVVPGNTHRVLALRGLELTVFGLPGQTFEVTAFNRPREPFSAPLAPAPLGGVLLPAGSNTSVTATLSALACGRLLIVLNVAAVTGDVYLNVNGLTPSGYVVPLLSPPGINAAGITVLEIGPALPVLANLTANAIVPESVQVVVYLTETATYGIDFVAAP